MDLTSFIIWSIVIIFFVIMLYKYMPAFRNEICKLKITSKITEPFLDNIYDAFIKKPLDAISDKSLHLDDVVVSPDPNLVKLLNYAGTPYKFREHLPTKEELGGINSVNTKKNGYIVQPDLMTDPAFSDVIMYQNDPNPYVTGETTGFFKCIEQCNGRCVEFGPTGDAMCYPK